MIQINALGERKLDVSLNGNTITVKMDDKVVWENREISTEGEGSVLLQSTWTDFGYSQRNIADDVYDAVFGRIEIKDLGTGDVLYTNKLQGVAKVLQVLKNALDWLVNWFIVHI